MTLSWILCVGFLGQCTSAKAKIVPLLLCVQCSDRAVAVTRGPMLRVVLQPCCTLTCDLPKPRVCATNSAMVHGAVHIQRGSPDGPNGHLDPRSVGPWTGANIARDHGPHVCGSAVVTSCAGWYPVCLALHSDVHKTAWRCTVASEL